MSDSFKRQCTRRPVPRRALPARIEECIPAGQAPLSAGCGGDDDAPGGHTRYLDGAYKISANQIGLWTYASTLPSETLPFIISIMASDDAFQSGRVEVRGNNAVRLTTGPPPSAGGPNMSAASTDGLDVQVSDTQVINLVQGVLGPKNHINIGSKGISVTTAQGPVWLESPTQIRLQVAGGTSYIQVAADGITLKGPLVQIN